MAMWNNVVRCKVVSSENTYRLHLNELEVKEERIIRKGNDDSTPFIQKGTEGEKCTK